MIGRISVWELELQACGGSFGRVGTSVEQPCYFAYYRAFASPFGARGKQKHRVNEATLSEPGPLAAMLCGSED